MFHFLFPFLLVVIVGVHVIFLHEGGSNNPLGIEGDGDKVPFHIYFSLKDLVGFGLVFWLLIYICLLDPDIFLESENFNLANPLSTPVHIQPEWYFLFAYAILRSIPNKGGGVLALVCSVIGLILFPFLAAGYLGCLSRGINPIRQILFWSFVGVFGVLT